MRFNLFMYCTVGRRHELEAGMAGRRPELYQRMLSEIAEYARFADAAGFYGFGHPEHHLQIEGFEAANDPGLMAMWLGQHSQRLRVITCGFVTTTHNPLRTAENIATLDHMLGGRFGVGLVRGYQARWVDNFRIRPDLKAVGPWNKNTAEDQLNRDFFAEFVDIVVTALKNETFNYAGKFWTFPPKNFVNPHRHTVYTDYGQGVDKNMQIEAVGIAPPPLQKPHPPLYGGFTASLRTAVFWARYGGKPIVLAENLEFCNTLWRAYRGEAEQWGHHITPGDEAGWGGLAICAETDAQAQEQLEDFRWFWDQWSAQFGQDFPAVLVGSADTISRRLEAAQTQLGFKDCFLLIPQGIHSRDQILRSLELLAEKVLPRFVDDPAGDRASGQ
jgi:alkanesulfonate monooxygenase SsuD/methylene tetrahydromethanopterin reductase-like flavin-dependent oxidoreductase (luciferase family)